MFVWRRRGSDAALECCLVERCLFTKWPKRLLRGIISLWFSFHQKCQRYQCVLGGLCCALILNRSQNNLLLLYTVVVFKHLFPIHLYGTSIIIIIMRNDHTRRVDTYVYIAYFLLIYLSPFHIHKLMYYIKSINSIIKYLSKLLRKRFTIL